ncbi:hypothetical protein Q7P37_002508 [Cladosporium fusiforme]
MLLALGNACIYTIWSPDLPNTNGWLAAKCSVVATAILVLAWIFNLSNKGSAEAELAGLHETYKSHALRIGPNELHIDDVSLFKQIYGQSSSFPKHATFYKAFGIDKSIFATADPELHRMLRTRLNPYFSHRAIAGVQSIITDSLEDYTARLAKRGYDEPINLYNLCRCLPADVITKYAYAKSCEAILSSNADFEALIFDSFDASASTTWSRAYFPFARWLQDSIPLAISARLSDDARKIQNFIQFSQEAYKAYHTGPVKPQHPVPFDALSDLPDGVVAGNATAIIAGGSDTTGYTFSFACWHLLHNPTLAERLIAEIDPVFEAAQPGYPDLTSLEKSPFLGAIVKEALRLGVAASSRLPRVVPRDAKQPLVVDDKVVPPGTVVSMSIYTMHHSKEIWGEDAHLFKPDRWLAPGATKLPSHLLAFSSGKRNCIGQNMANAELYFGIAYLFNRFNIELCTGQDRLVTVDRFTASIESPFDVYLKPRRV